MTLEELSILAADLTSFVANCKVVPSNVRVQMYGQDGIPRKIRLSWTDPVVGAVSMSREIQ